MRFAACRPPMANGQSIYIRGFGGPIPMRNDRTVNYKVAIYWWSDDLHLVCPLQIEAEIIGKCAFANASSNSCRAGCALKIFGLTQRKSAEYGLFLQSDLGAIQRMLVVGLACQNSNCAWALGLNGCGLARLFLPAMRMPLFRLPCFSWIASDAL